jgi:hypothetical protein
VNVRLKYVTAFTLDPGSGTDKKVFNLNGLFDPEVAIGGHQPSNFDVWMTVYTRYTAHTCDIKMTSLENTPSQAGDVRALYGFFISQTGADVSPSTPFTQLAEQPYVKYSQVSAGVGFSPYAELDARIPIDKWLGVQRPTDLLAEQDYSGTAAANPSRNIFAECFATEPLGQTVANPGYYKVELTYGVWFDLPRQTTFS